MSELKAVLEITTAHPGTRWTTTTPLTHSYSNNDVIQLGPLGSDAMFEVVKVSDACSVQLYLQYDPHAPQLDLNLANVEATVAAKWTLAFLFRNFTVVRAFWWRETCVISLRSVVQEWWYFFNNFSVTLNVKMNCARNYENLLNFVKVMPKILVVPFFLDTMYYRSRVQTFTF